MHQKLADNVIKSLPVPEKGAKIYYDSEVIGLGCRVSAGGTRAFILNYRTRSGRERRFTIGGFPDWKIGAARDEARALRKMIDRGDDPMADLQAGREAPTVSEMCDRFIEEHLPKKRPSTQRDYLHLINSEIRPSLRNVKVADVVFSDVDKLHRAITKRGSPYQANRTVATLSKIFSMAIKWGWIKDNPAKGIERNQEIKRTRYLTGPELASLTIALAEHEDQQSANILRLLLLTGARRGEVLGLTWDQLNLETGVWVKPGSTTKQKTEHRVPLSAPARQLLAELKVHADESATFVFPSRTGGHRVDIKKNWAAIRKTAGIADARMHDLRHTYASVLASAGMSLPIIGALLGHSQPATTARYAHLLDDPLRQATERAGAIVMGAHSAEVIQIKGTNRGKS